MIYTQNLTLDVYQQQQFQYINAVQFDNNARQLVITPTANGEKITIPTTASAVFRCLKQDGTSVINPATIDTNAGTVTCELTNQCLACEGMTRADISIIDGVDIISTLTFFIMVETAPTSEEHIESTDEFLFIVEVADKVQKQATAAEISANNAKASEEKAAAAANGVESNANAAIEAANSAKESADSASMASSNAETSASAAKAAQTAAEAAKTAAETAKSDAQTSAAEASSAKTAAEQSAAEAAQSAESASQSATSASESSASAKQSKEATATSEANALSSKNSAAESASSALESKNAAAESASASATSEANAASSASAAQAAQAAAEKARDEAQEIVGGDYATKTELSSHTGDTNIHITSTERNAWNNKVDKEDGKGLSTNDYTTAEKNKVANLPSDTNTALSNKVDKVSGKGLSTNDYTNTEKTKLSSLNAAIIVKSSVAVATSDWASDTTYTDYPYRASIAIDGCTINHIPEVVFSLVDAMSGTFAPIAETYDGGVYIYASEQPADITIPTIKLVKVVV